MIVLEHYILTYSYLCGFVCMLPDLKNKQNNTIKQYKPNESNI